MLSVHKTMFKIQAIRLNDIRPFVFDHVELSKSQTENGISLDPRNMTQIEDFLIRRIERILQQQDFSKKRPELRLPLVRLKIENTGFPVIKSKRVTDHFLNKIANPMDFLQFYKKSGFISGLNTSRQHDKVIQSANALLPGSSINGGPTIIGLEADENKMLLDRLIKRKLRENSRLNLVPTNKMAQMIDKYVTSNDSHALETFFDHEVFRKSYHEIRRSMLDNVNGAAAAITEEFEH